MIKVLVVTLYSGENEYDQCCDSVKSQSGLIVDHKVIKNLPKQEAHQKLYKLFNDSREDFDYLAKLDADMAFSSPQSLINIVSEFNDGIDVISATVHDGITDSDIQSFNIFSPKCYFHYESNDPLFTDKLVIDYPGAQYSYIDKERNVLHAFNPSPFQAFTFGVHRALKVVQPGAKIPSLSNSYHQRYILNQAYNHYAETGSEHARQALLGATLVFQGVIDSPALFQKSDYIAFFEVVASKVGEEVDPRLSENSLFSLVKVFGWKRFFIGAFGQVLQKLRLEKTLGFR